MTKTERHNYQIAIFCSILIHGIMLFFHLPDLFYQGVALKTFPVGVVELLPGSGKSAPNPRAETKNPVTDSPQLTDKPAAKTQKSETVKQLPPEKPETNPREQVVTAPDTAKPKPDQEPNLTSADNHRPLATGAGNINSRTPAPPQGLGSGEGKVFRLGALPSYPKNALNEGIEGEITLRILVFQDGGLERVELLSSSGDARLDKAAVKAVNSWQFKPESSNYFIDICFVFRIRDGVSLRFINAATRP